MKHFSQKFLKNKILGFFSSFIEIFLIKNMLTLIFFEAKKNKLLICIVIFIIFESKISLKMLCHYQLSKNQKGVEFVFS